MVRALIPARAGSKGVPGKNLRPLLGRTLIDYAVTCARESGVVDQIWVTTEDQAIAEEADRCGASVVMRPAHMATDGASMVEVVRHALRVVCAAPADAILLLQPTSPLRTPQSLVEALRRLRAHPDADSVVSVSPVPAVQSPDYLAYLHADGTLQPFIGHWRVVRRQDVRPAYQRDGVVYAFTAEVVEAYGTLYGHRCLPLITPPTQSVSIDTEADWTDAEFRLRRRETARWVEKMFWNSGA